MHWHCAVCAITLQAVPDDDTREGAPRCPLCGAPLQRRDDDPRRQHRDDPRNARARDEREHKPH